MCAGKSKVTRTKKFGKTCNPASAEMRTRSITTSIVQLLHDSGLLSFDVQRTLSIPRLVSPIAGCLPSGTRSGLTSAEFHILQAFVTTRCCQYYFVHILYFFEQKCISFANNSIHVKYPMFPHGSKEIITIFKYLSFRKCNILRQFCFSEQALTFFEKYYQFCYIHALLHYCDGAESFVEICKFTFLSNKLQLHRCTINVKWFKRK